jgi:hypothetical protein
MDISFHPYCIALYPEIHYTFDLFFSRLRHNQPEMFIDCPHRIDPGKPLPVLCLIKHADRFPISLDSIGVSVEYEDGRQDEQLLWSTPTLIHGYLWYTLFDLNLREGYSGDIHLSATIQFERGHRRYRITNHNYRGTTKAAMKVHIAREPLPTSEHWYYGESHCHSFHSDDQIEFGAPVSATAAMANAMGLRWLAITDHSYDVDDVYGRIFQSDATLSKWMNLNREIELENRRNDVTVLLGEEISCGNARHKNVHVLAYGIQHFIPGCGDGAERWFRTGPDFSLTEVLSRIQDDGGIAYAAHPEERFSLAERLMLRRGHWEQADYELPHYCGLQFWNGKRDRAFHRGYDRWIELLLEGKHIYFIGGDDAHGDFHTFRQIRIPLLKMIDSPHKVFGKVRTGLLCTEGPDQQSVLRALANGNIIVTSGPFITGTAHNETGERVSIGQTISGNTIHFGIEAQSTEEFGSVEQIILCQGNLKEKTENKRVYHLGTDFHHPTHIRMTEIPINVDCPVYLRLEAVSRNNGDMYYAYTNPIWIQPG